MKTRFGKAIGKATATAARRERDRIRKILNRKDLAMQMTGVDAPWVQIDRTPEHYAGRGFRREWDRQLTRWARMGNLDTD